MDKAIEKKKEINKYKRTCVLFAYGTQIILSVYQAIVPTALTSSLGVALNNLSVFSVMVCNLLYENKNNK